MQQIKGSSHTTVYNNSGTNYIKGDNFTDGSIRIIYDTDGISVSQIRENGVWNDSKHRVKEICLSRDTSISAAGHFLLTDSKSDGTKTLVIHSHFDDTGSVEPEVPILPAKEIRTVTQADNSGVVTGLLFGYTVTPTSNQLISRIYYQSGSTPATKDIILRAYVGTDNTGILYLQQVIPLTSWTANTEIQVDIVGLLGYKTGLTLYGELTSEENFSIKTDVTLTQPFRAADRFIYVRERVSHAPPWSAKIWDKDEWVIDGGKIYVCNSTSAQSGSFEANTLKWDLLSDLIAKVLNYKGAITVENFNALTSGEKGDQYKISNSGTLVGGIATNANDTVIIRATFSSRAILVSDYDRFPESSDIVLQAGRSLGQQIAGGTGASETLVLKSTEHATKGNIYIGTSVYDEVNNRLGLGRTPTANALEVNGNVQAYGDIITDGNNTRNIGTAINNLANISSRKITSNEDLTLDTGSTKAVIIKSNAGTERVKFDGDGANTKWTNKVHYPAVDAVDSFNFTKADKVTSVLNLDTTNNKVTVNNCFGLPKLTTTQRNSLSGLIGGEIVFDSSIQASFLYDGTFWIQQ